MTEPRALQHRGELWVPTNLRDLLEPIVGPKIPELERMRRYYGRSTTPEVIEQVTYAATQGYMRDLTDLTNETIGIDPHFASVIGKRFRALMSIEPQFVPASGPGLDPKRAAEIAQSVRDIVTRIPRFRRAMLQLAWARCHGRAALEIHWRYSPRGSGMPAWTVESLGWVHPRRLSFGPDRELRVRDSLWQGYGFEPIGLDLREVPGKFITSTPQLFNEYPEREGFGPRGLYWSFFKRFGQRERMVLLEVFGKPWRIITVDPTTAKDISVQQDALDAAKLQVDTMGASSSAVLPKGLIVKTDQPTENAGQIHREVIQDSNDEISKLVLGQTRTTEAEPSGIGSGADQVAQDSESLVIAADAFELSDDLTEQLIRPIVALNWGDGALEYAPHLELRYVLPPPRSEQIANTTAALGTGLPLRVDQVYERLGFDRPSEDDETVTQEAPPPMPGGFGFTGGADPLGPLRALQAQVTRTIRLSRGSGGGSSQR
jgi:phage gp29-like protein